MKSMKFFAMVVILTLAGQSLAQTKDDHKIMKDAEEAKAMLTSNSADLNMFFANAEGYVIFPNVGEGALLVGAASGNGVLYEKDKAVGMANLKKLDFGLQAGGQVLTQVIFFETKEALARFKEDQLEFSGEASAILVKDGTSINADYEDGVVVFAYPKTGVMADLSVGGQNFEYTSFEEMKMVK